MGEGFDSVDILPLGRTTSEEWTSYWPTSTDEPYASFVNTTPEVVVSETLNEIFWGNYNKIFLLEGTFAKGIKAIRDKLGKTISILGSPTLVCWLLEHNLFDEPTLIVFPIVAGTGGAAFRERHVRYNRASGTSVREIASSVMHHKPSLLFQIDTKKSKQGLEAVPRVLLFETL